MGETHKNSQLPAEPPSASTAEKRRKTKKIVITIGLAVVLYLFSYGLAVTKTINHYGRSGPFVRALYTPAGWLSEHWGLFHDYSLYWVRVSRNHQWWIEQAGREFENPLVPSHSNTQGELFQPNSSQ